MVRPFTFDLESCRDLLLKMERELERLNGTDIFELALAYWTPFIHENKIA